MQQAHHTVSVPFLSSLAFGDMEPEIVQPVTIEDHVAGMYAEIIRRQDHSAGGMQPLWDEFLDGLDHTSSETGMDGTGACSGIGISDSD